MTMMIFWKRPICLIFGHEWSEAGFDDVCSRCGKIVFMMCYDDAEDWSNWPY